MAMHTQVRVPALPMPDHALAVDDPVAGIPVVITAADITVTKDTAIKKTVSWEEKAIPHEWPFSA